MMNFVTFLRMAGYFIILFTPITYLILVVILKIAKKNTKKFTRIVVCSYIGVFALYLSVMYGLPYHTGGITREDAKEIASMIQIYEDEGNVYDLTVKPNEQYIDNEFGIAYDLDKEEDDLFSSLDVSVTKYSNVEKAKEVFYNWGGNHVAATLSPRIWEIPEENFDIYVTAVEVEDHFPLPPNIMPIRYIADVFIRYENYLLRFHSYTMGENLNFKHAIFFLLEKNPNLEYWLTHYMGYGRRADGTIENYDPVLVDPRWDRWERMEKLKELYS